MTTKADILRAIRQKCLDCSCYQPNEVRLCPVTRCELWPYRFGRDPEPSKTRGFSKSHLYTSGSTGEGTEGHPGTGPVPSRAESLVYTDDSEREEPIGAKGSPATTDADPEPAVA